MNINNELSKLGRSLSSAKFLTYFGVSGAITSIFLAAKIAPKAADKIKYNEEKNGKELTLKEKVLLVWKMYIPVGVTAGVSSTAIIFANAKNERKNAALATANAIVNTTFSEYKEKVKETIGEKTNQKIEEKLDSEKIKKSNNVATNLPMVENDKQTLCYDAMFGRYFYSEKNKIDAAVNTLNREMTCGIDASVSLNDFYYELGLPQVNGGDELGWSTSKDLIEIRYSSQLLEDGRPVLVMSFETMPVANYYKF